MAEPKNKHTDNCNVWTDWTGKKPCNCGGKKG